MTKEVKKMAKVGINWWKDAKKRNIDVKISKFDDYCIQNNYKLATKETLLIFCELEEGEYENLKNSNIIAYNTLKMKIRILENNIKLHLLNETKGGVYQYMHSIMVVKMKLK
ncbi:hypothetical protein SKUN_001010 [Spiroplasma kunkelii CR2-3x]|uniref:Uncharacterized protein n=2 Tax=Spiroplasma kunkelii TaxID=47834 RepID=A0A0K2JI39_SPIKU|nr:hypothetical protein SKUN_001010 [Spiroplasma kunkelii CR2-3x]